MDALAAPKWQLLVRPCSHPQCCCAALLPSLQTLAAGIEQADKDSMKPKDWERMMPSTDLMQQCALQMLRMGWYLTSAVCAKPL